MKVLTKAEQEQAFQRYLQREAESLALAKPAPLPEGAEAVEPPIPWHGNDEAKRRELFMRRYRR